MRVRDVLLGLCGAVAAASLAGCDAGLPVPGPYATEQGESPFPSSYCNPALVVNPDFLAPNEGPAGAGGPAPPGIGAPTGPWCLHE